MFDFILLLLFRFLLILIIPTSVRKGKERKKVKYQDDDAKCNLKILNP